MTQIKATVVGSLNVEANISKFTKESKQLLKQAVFKGVADVEKDAKTSIQRGGKSGFVYQRYNPRRTHKASAPGQPPASDTGNLVSQIMSVADGKNTLVESRAEYSKFLEFGTSKMLPRPFLFPASEKSTKKIVQVLIQKLNKVAQGLKK